MTLSKTKQQKILDHYRKGLTQISIAIDLKIDVKTVRKYLQLNGLLTYSYPKTQQHGPPSPFDYPIDFTNERQQITPLNDSLGANLTHELDKKNQENEELTQEITKHKTEKESMKQEMEKLQKTMNELKANNVSLNQDYQRNLEEIKELFTKEKINIKQDYQRELTNIKQDYHNSLDKQKNNNTKLINTIKENHIRELEEKKNIITAKDKKQEEDQQTINNTVSKAKERIESLQKEVSTSKEKANESYKDGFINGLFLGATGGIAGTLLIQKFLSPPSNTTQPRNINPRKSRPVINAFPIPTEMLTQSEIDYLYSGINPVTNISGTTCSGTFNNNYGGIHNAKCNTPINQQDAEIINNPETSNEYNLSTNTSIDPCLEAYISNNGNNNISGHIIFTDPQENQNQSGISNSCNPETYTYDCSSSGINNFNHNEYIDYRPELKKAYYINPTPQTGYIPYTPSYTKPSDYNLPFTTRQNLKNNLKTKISQYIGYDKTGTRLVDLIEKLYKHRGARVDRQPKTNDKGVDLIVYLGYDISAIQAKDRKEKIGIPAIQEVFGAKSYHTELKINRAIVITTSEFTRQALDFAEKLGVECWDYEKLLDEMIDSQFYLTL